MRRSFAALMLAEGISVFGSRMTFVALPWLALVIIGSATRTGVVAFAETLPYVLANAVGGPLVDRLSARRTSIVADTASVVAGAHRADRGRRDVRGRRRRRRDPGPLVRGARPRPPRRRPAAT
jgi:MFS family permease